MAASTQDTLEGIERRRAQLQESVEKLRKALAHWSTWEAEYQMLTDEVQSVEDATPAQIRTIAQNLDSALLDGKEIEELLGKDLDTKRTANQVVDMISRRIDYVQQNSATIEKQLDAAEKQLAGVDILLEPGMENEEGLPMMDIEEELDEQGNAISSAVNQTGKAAAEIAEVLRKVGLQKAEMEKQKQNGGTKKETLDKASSTPLPTTPAKTTASPAETLPKPQPKLSPDRSGTEPSKKSVSFAEDTKPEMPAKVALEQEGYNDALEAMNFTRGTKVIELDEDDNELASYPVIPQGESPEDAELRRQMLQYGLSEVGQIVAELNLDNPTAEYSDDEGDETEDEEYEDEYGRSLKPVVTEEYRKQMLELENKLNDRMMENVGPQHDGESLAEHADDVRTLRIRKDEDFDHSLDATKIESNKAEAKKKGVRFADALDVSEAPQPVPQPTVLAETRTQAAPTMSDTIVERPMTGSSATATPSQPAKVSRFKSGRAGASQPPQFLPNPAPIPEPQVVPSGPSGRTLAKTITEHDASSAEPNAPDEFDPAVINREIQAEYNKARNRYIQQNDGFKPTQEDIESPMVEDKDGKTKKVSRFMAARLKGSGM
jgi:unconventional prefoldin RPB5 interactor 1